MRQPRIGLVGSIFVDSFFGGFRYHPQLGLACLASAAKKAGFDARIIDPNHYLIARDLPVSRIAVSAIAGHIDEQRFDVVGFSTCGDSFHLTLEMAERCKRPDNVVVLGGPFATLVDREILEAFPFIDLVVRGEGEVTLVELIRALSTGGSLGGIRGLSCAGGGRYLRNEDRPLIDDLDSLPMPEYDSYPGLEQHLDVLPIDVGRGCPYGCWYCSSAHFWGRRSRLKSPTRVLREIRLLNARFGTDTFKLVHDLFTLDRRFVASFCAALARLEPPIYWGCTSRADTIDEEMLSLMRSAHAVGILFGVESGSQRILERFGKRLRSDQVEQAVLLGKKYIDDTQVAIIVGHPEEEAEDLRQTLSSMMRYFHRRCSRVVTSYLIFFPGTILFRQFRDRLTFDVGFLPWGLDNDLTREYAPIMADYPEIFPQFRTTAAQRSKFPQLYSGLEVFSRMLNAVCATKPQLFDVAWARFDDALDFFLDWREVFSRRPGYDLARNRLNADDKQDRMLKDFETYAAAAS